ncbi:MAG: aminoacyl-tRNA hydrolase [Armatimonadota bacterium]|nr:aminoacyl-tRNA hydrolase [Armatimonadota bacterium]MDR5697029.1 aminoacyl-tRNA hydrolase [Armatimonadota bacterium]
MKLVVGLGNPGRRYRGTRHNVGWDVLDVLARRWDVDVSHDEGYATVGRGVVAGRHVWLAKPWTYMNLSGVAVRELARRHRWKPHEILVIYDDMDLPVGTIRVRARGSAGGHRGMASVIEELGTSEIPRVRIGIGRSGADAVDHVLSRFDSAEEPVIRQAVARAADAVEAILREGIEQAMDRFNRRAALSAP